MGTWREVDTRALLPPLSHTLWTAWGWLGGLAKQLPTAAQRPSVVPVGEEAVMPETPKAAGEPMPQEAAETCVGVACQSLDTMALTTVPVGKADPPIPHVEDPRVGDGDAMGRAADIVQDVGRACQGRLGVDDSCFGVELPPKLREVRRRSQGEGALNARHGAGGAKMGQRLAALPAQDRAQGSPRTQEAGIGRHPARPVGSECASRQEAMDMAMRPQGLIPGMEDHGTPELPAEVAPPTLHARLTRRVDQQGQQRSLVHEDEGVEVVWHGKHQVAIRHRQPRGLAVRNPLDLGQRLTRGAVTMATGMRRVPLEPTAGTVFGVPSALRRPADLDVVPHLLLHGWYGMVTAGRLPVEADEIGDCPRWSAGRTPGWLPGAVGGMRSHGRTPVWAGVGPRRGGGRTGCGVSPDAVG